MGTQGAVEAARTSLVPWQREYELPHAYLFVCVSGGGCWYKGRGNPGIFEASRDFSVPERAETSRGSGLTPRPGSPG